jgi:hypothetical protein
VADSKKDNAGAKRIRELHPERGGAAKVAALVDADPSAVSRWFSGDRKPDTKMRALIERQLGIGWQLWDEVVAPEASNDGSPATGTGG